MRAADQPLEPAPAGSRALVPIGPGTAAPDATGSRPCGLFVAQLIAVAQQSPQTRRHRRATPEEARLAYAAGSAPPVWLGRSLYRST